MSTTAHDDWVHKFSGVHPRRGASQPAADAGPAPGAVPAAGNDKQAQEFKAAFSPVLAGIDGHLGYTATHAEAAAHAAQAQKRETLVAAYGTALRQIDPADEAKAKGAIGKVLATASGVAAAIAKFRQDAEKAYNDWQSRQANYDDTNQKLGEMEDWGHPKAPTLDAPMDAVQADIDARRYAPACTGFDKLLPQFTPIYDDYLKQKAAQAQYEPARAALDPRLTKAQVSEFKKLEPMQAEFPGAVTAMDAAVQAKDYVKALQAEQDTETKVTAYETALADLEAKKKAYEDGLAAVQPQLDKAAGQPEHKKLAPLKSDLDAVRGQMEKAAQDEEFDAALGHAQDLGSKAESYNQAVDELEQQKKQYEDAAAQVQPRVTAASTSQFKALAPAQSDIADLAKQMETAAADEDYVGALKDATDLGSKLDAYETALADIEAKKKQYEDGRTAAQPKLDAVANPSHPKLQTEEKTIADIVTSMDKAAADEDFESAAQMVGDVGDKADAYAEAVKALEEKKQQYQAAWDKVKPRLDNINSTRSDALAPMQQAILAHQQEIDKLVEGENYDDAIASIETLSRELDEYENADENKIYIVEYKGKKYAGTQTELVALRAAMAAAAIKDAFQPLKNKAEYHSGYYNDLKALNDKQYIVGWIVSVAGGADLGALGSAVSAQAQAVDALQRAINADVGSAGPSYQSAVTAINAAGSALTRYMDAIDVGGARTIAVLQAIEVVSFSIAAACGAAILAPAGASLAATMGANAISGAGFGALEEAAKQTGGALTGIDAPKSAGDALVKITKSAALNGIGAALGSGAGKLLKGKVCEQIFRRAAVDNPVVKKKIEDFVEGALAGAVQTVVSNAPDVYQGKMTWDQLAVLIAENMIGGGVGGILGNKLKAGEVNAKTGDIVTGGVVAAGTMGKEIKKDP